MKTIKAMIKVVVLALPLAAIAISCESLNTDFDEIETEASSTDGGDDGEPDHDKPGIN